MSRGTTVGDSTPTNNKPTRDERHQSLTSFVANIRAQLTKLAEQVEDKGLKAKLLDVSRQGAPDWKDKYQALAQLVGSIGSQLAEMEKEIEDGELKFKLYDMSDECGYEFLKNAFGDSVCRGSELEPITEAYNLEQVYGSLVDKLPVSHHDHIEFSAQNLLEPPEHLETSKLIIKKSAHGYGSDYGYWQVDLLLLEAHKRTYRLLALLVLAKIFHEAPLVRLRLTHPASQIREIRLNYYRHDGWYETRPYRFKYFRRSEPFTWWHIPDEDKPSMALMAQRGQPMNESEWQTRDIVWAAGSERGHIHLAQFLLDLGNPNEDIERLYLECDLGNFGVGKFSAELMFTLPSYIGWSGKLDE